MKMAAESNDTRAAAELFKKLDDGLYELREQGASHATQEHFGVNLIQFYLHAHMVKFYDKQHGTPCEQIRHQQEVEALQQRLAEVEQAHAPLRWTKEKPTESGWYWMRRMDLPSHPYGMCEIRQTMVHLKDYWESFNGLPPNWVCEWAGPIEPPRDEEG